MLNQIPLSVLRGKHVVVPISEPVLPFGWVVWLRRLRGPGFLLGARTVPEPQCVLDDWEPGLADRLAGTPGSQFAYYRVE